MRFDGRGGTPAYFAVAHHRDFCQVILVWWYSPVDAATLTLPSPAKRARVRILRFMQIALLSPSRSPLGEGWGEGNLH